MPDSAPAPTPVSAVQLVLAALAVAATYGYFLLFAEFAFLELARPALGDGASLRFLMGALGAGGVLGSLLAGLRLPGGLWSRRLALGFAACALAAALAPGHATPPLAFAVGLALGHLTVTLASGLRRITGPRRLGLVAGAGTGLAYAWCNLPSVFTASPLAQSRLAALLTVGGAIVALLLRPAAANPAPAPASRAAITRWTTVFLALVWMDSAAFYIIQHTEALRAATWTGAWTLWGNAAMHLAAALAAALLLDRGRLGAITFAAALALALACLGLRSGDNRVELLYTAGVSLYSAALVYFAAHQARPLIAALVFSVAGWLGSALGIGLAQDLHTVPPWFPVAALLVVTAALFKRRTIPLLAVGALLLLAPPAARAEDPSVTLGREVYLAEGCIHCHSQYIRPGTADVLRWGPARPLEDYLAQSPPLFGNRRQGPDLANVGNRRSPEWNRLHLLAPRLVSPGSRMPAYGHLFRAQDPRGDALLAYLDSLGAGTESARAATIAAWQPAPATVADPALGRALFAQLCITCHGPAGRGDGPLASRLGAPPPDWPGAGWRRLTPAPSTDEETTQLARIIKFGLPGTPMAGHESLDDSAVVSLARHVASLHAAPQSTP